MSDLGSLVDGSVNKSVRNSVSNAVWMAGVRFVRGSVYDPIHISVERSVYASVGSFVKYPIHKFVWDYVITKTEEVISDE